MLPAGEAAARLLAPRLAEVDFGLVLTGPLRRERDTAALAGFADAEVMADAVVWNYGEYEGITNDEFRATVPGWSVWHSRRAGR